MADHLRRKVENYLCQQLGADTALMTALPWLVCLPSDADAPTTPNDASKVRSYVVAEAVRDGGKEDETPREPFAPMPGGEWTTQDTVAVRLVCSTDDTPATERSSAFREVALACQRLKTGDFPALGLIIHGADFMGTGQEANEATNARSDAAYVSIGATDMGEPVVP